MHAESVCTYEMHTWLSTACSRCCRQPVGVLELMGKCMTRSSCLHALCMGLFNLLFEEESLVVVFCKPSFCNGYGLQKGVDGNMCFCKGFQQPANPVTETRGVSKIGPIPETRWGKGPVAVNPSTSTMMTSSTLPSITISRKVLPSTWKVH
jgi:hypothetical protein